MRDLPFDLIGFDLDGTLVDTGRDLTIATNHALGTIGLSSLPEATIRGFVGRGAGDMLERSLAAAGAEGALAEALLPALLDHYAEHMADHSLPYEGLVEALDWLREAGIRLAVCTNKREGLARSLLATLGLADYFVAIVGGDTLGPSHLKPKPDLLLEMIAQAGGGTALFIGDSDNDVGAARAAGIPVLVIDTGYTDSVVAADLGADGVFGHYGELVPLLGGLR